jgi:hypothetical protein
MSDIGSLAPRNRLYQEHNEVAIRVAPGKKRAVDRESYLRGKPGKSDGKVRVSLVES